MVKFSLDFRAVVCFRCRVEPAARRLDGPLQSRPHTCPRSHCSVIHSLPCIGSETGQTRADNIILKPNRVNIYVF